MTLLALDPGLVHPAAALFVEGRLICASRIRVDSAWKTLDIGERCRRVAQNVHLWARGYGLGACGRLVVEWPQVYRAGRAKGDPNDLLPLVGVAMCLAGTLRAEQVQALRPAEWIGQLPKFTTGDPLTSPRGRLIWSILDDAERGGVTVSHDSLDAVGLGLFALGRLVRRCYPRG
jgi:hypothetical protein